MWASTERQAAQPHWAVLGLCLALLAGTAVGALFVSVDETMRLGSRALPSICTLKNLTGLPCPGCGLTRSWVALAQGRPGASLAHHRLGWLVMLYVALQAVRHAAWLSAPARRSSVDRAGRWLDRAIIALAALLLVNWVVTLSG